MMMIGIFDSGIGGLTVLKEALKVLPDERYLYFADTANVPYGPKGSEEVRKFILEGVERMAAKGLKALVVACNTATSIAVADLRRIYQFPILGMEPAVKPALGKSRGKRVLVVATELTLKEQKFKNLVCSLDSDNVVDSLPLPGLVEFAENLVFDRDVVLGYLSDKFSAFDLNQYGTVVLGCTHFPFYRRCFYELFPEGTEVIDGNEGTVRNLARVLSEKGMLERGGRGQVEFLSSDEEWRKPDRFINCLGKLGSDQNS